MSESITFAEVHNYDTLKSGITVGVSLWFEGQSVDCEAKIDTGSSHSIFKRAYGELLEIDIESVEPVTVSTITGNFIAFPHYVELTVFGIRTQTSVLFAADNTFTRNVLGRMGWLDRVKLGLIDYEGKLFLSSYE